MMGKEKDILRCANCGGELEMHPLLRDTRVCRQCEIEYDRNNQRIDWESLSRHWDNVAQGHLHL